MPSLGGREEVGGGAGYNMPFLFGLSLTQFLLNPSYLESNTAPHARDAGGRCPELRNQKKRSSLKSVYKGTQTVRELFRFLYTQSQKFEKLGRRAFKEPRGVNLAPP